MMHVREKLEAIINRYHSIEEQMADPEIVQDIHAYQKLNKEYKYLSPIVQKAKLFHEIESGIHSTKEILNGEDKELAALARPELDDLEQQKKEIEEEIKILLIPRDPEDDKDVIIEIRSGTGGDEASIFAGDLFRMYSKFIEKQDWKTDVLYVNEGSVGGYNKIAFEVSGEEVYRTLKFESGAHRVQRIPKTESQGRVHTSAATVVVMPKVEMEESNIRKEDLKVDTFRSSGAGGQHVNKTESGVRFTHLPTGIVAESTDGRSQIRNREIALQRLAQKIKDAEVAAHESKMTAERKSLVGSGDRSDKIRTYNFPQNRVTDHRINLTLYNLDKIIEGNLEEIFEALSLAENARKLSEPA